MYVMGGFEQGGESTERSSTLEAGLEEELEFVEESLEVAIVVRDGKSRVFELLAKLAHAL